MSLQKIVSRRAMGYRVLGRSGPGTGQHQQHYDENTSHDHPPRFVKARRQQGIIWFYPMSEILDVRRDLLFFQA